MCDRIVRSPLNPSASIRFERVVRRYPTGTVALDGFDLGVGGGEFVALLGPSGCGKSTALRLAAGLEEPTSGRLVVDVGSAGPHPVAFVFQEATLLPWRRVAANVALPLELRGASGADRLVGDALGRVGLAGFEQHYPRELSGGMRMRASLARALVTRPRLLLLDEPFGALDEITRQKLQEDLLTLHATEGFTVLFVTHSVFEAVYLADRVVVMTARPGRVAADVRIDLPRPRPPELRTDPEFARQVGEIGRRLREQLG
jgi:NitT/TauT family transport system ATP-binding protein